MLQWRTLLNRQAQRERKIASAFAPPRLHTSTSNASGITGITTHDSWQRSLFVSLPSVLAAEQLSRITDRNAEKDSHRLPPFSLTGFLVPDSVRKAFTAAAAPGCSDRALGCQGHPEFTHVSDVLLAQVVDMMGAGGVEMAPRVLDEKQVDGKPL